jgi:hypothetical protein
LAGYMKNCLKNYKVISTRFNIHTVINIRARFARSRNALDTAK